MDGAEHSPDQEGDTSCVATENPSQEAVSPKPEQDKQKEAFAELNDRFLRLAADFDNFRRRTEKERESVVALANERFAIDLLEVVDNFDRALKSDDSRLREGVEQIRQLLSAQLQRHGITPIDSLKKQFDPAEHEAIAHVPSGDPEGVVIDEIVCGYRMNEKVIRHAKVAVSKGNTDCPR